MKAYTAGKWNWNWYLLVAVHEPSVSGTPGPVLSSTLVVPFRNVKVTLLPKYCMLLPRVVLAVLAFVSRVLGEEEIVCCNLNAVLEHHTRLYVNSPSRSVRAQVMF